VKKTSTAQGSYGEFQSQEVKRGRGQRGSSGNACYHSVPNRLYSLPLSKNVKVRIYSTIILPAVLYGCEIWSLTLREQQRLWVFENRVLRKYLDQRGMK
jgi:hypothetical protein